MQQRLRTHYRDTSDGTSGVAAAAYSYFWYYFFTSKEVDLG